MGHEPGLYPLCPLVSLSVGTVTEYTITQVEQTRGCAGMWQRERVAGEERGNRLPKVSGDGCL